MKRTLFITALTLVLGITIISCNNSGIIPSKNYITRDYKVENSFDRLNISTMGDVFYNQSPDGNFSVSVYGPDNIVEYIEMKVENNVLNISTPNLKNLRRLSNMKINISSPELHGINFRGAGNISIEDSLRTTTLEIRSRGVGDLKINNLVCKDIDIHTSGVGNVKIAGNAKTASVTSRGVGDVNVYDLKVKTANVSNNGVGNIFCYASDTITAANRGVGNITYGGNPAIRNIVKSGVGLIQAN